MAEIVHSRKKIARAAGFLYLMVVVTSVYSLMYVPTQILVKGDPALTAHNILTNEFLFRSGIVSNLICQVIFVFLAMTLFRLLKEVDGPRAGLMVALVIVQIPIVFVVETIGFTSLMIVKGELLNTFSLEQREELMMTFFRIRSNGIAVLQIFWGLWLVPFGQLVYRSGFIPRLLGILLILAGTFITIDSLIYLLLPTYPWILNTLATLMSLAGEFSIMFWLIIKGVKDESSKLETDSMTATS